jgi:cysteine protease ATG4
MAATNKPLLVLFPLRLGIDKVNPVYYDLIKGALKSHLSVGVVGGRPNRSLYFVGFQDDDLFYLDPHCVRPALVSVRDALATLELHGDTVRACSIADLDPSMLLGFVCADSDELVELKAQLEGLHAGCPLFSFP